MNTNYDKTSVYDIRRASERGRMELGWLSARFSFSFGPWRSPGRDNFSALLALNEDVIEPGTGFDMHPHDNLEIFIYPLAGTIEHRDSLGNHALVRPGEIQKMTSGSGIRHSQMNASREMRDHHLQIWLQPRTRNAPPGVAQQRFDPARSLGRWQALVTPDGAGATLPVDQDARIFVTRLGAGEVLPFEGNPARSLYLHVARGGVTVEAGSEADVLAAGDAVAMRRGGSFLLRDASPAAEVLLFDLPPE